MNLRRFGLLFCFRSIDSVNNYLIAASVELSNVRPNCTMKSANEGGGLGVGRNECVKQAELMLDIIARYMANPKNIFQV